MQRPATARLAPVTDPDERQRELMQTDLQRGEQPLAIFATMAHNPGLMRKVTALGGRFLFRGTLDVRAREVVILADHSVVGLESRVQAARLNRLHTIFTDAGTLPAHRLDLSTAGLRVIVADEDEDEDGEEEAPLRTVPPVKKAHR